MGAINHRAPKLPASRREQSCARGASLSEVASRARPVHWCLSPPSRARRIAAIAARLINDPERSKPLFIRKRPTAPVGRREGCAPGQIAKPPIVSHHLGSGKRLDLGSVRRNAQARDTVATVFAEHHSLATPIGSVDRSQAAAHGRDNGRGDGLRHWRAWRCYGMTDAMSKPPKAKDEAPRRNRARATGDIIGDIGGPAFKRFGFVQSAVVSRWKEIVGERYAKVSSPESIRFPTGKKPEHATCGRRRARAMVQHIGR